MVLITEGVPSYDRVFFISFFLLHECSCFFCRNAMQEVREDVLSCSSQEDAWELVTFLLFLLPYERSVAVLRRCCYVSFATVNYAVHLFAYGRNYSGGNDSARGEAQ